jgi:hypothetical protein
LYRGRQLAGRAGCGQAGHVTGHATAEEPEQFDGVLRPDDVLVADQQRRRGNPTEDLGRHIGEVPIHVLELRHKRRLLLRPRHEPQELASNAEPVIASAVIMSAPSSTPGWKALLLMLTDASTSLRTRSGRRVLRHGGAEELAERVDCRW